jgi:hypothetical protein
LLSEKRPILRVVDVAAAVTWFGAYPNQAKKVNLMLFAYAT